MATTATATTAAHRDSTPCFTMPTAVDNRPMSTHPSSSSASAAAAAKANMVSKWASSSASASAGSISETTMAGLPSNVEDSENEEPIEQLVYTSSAYTRDLPEEDIEQILSSSRRNNVRDDITGLLLYRDGSFVQFLEGPRSKVRACYNRISRDARHRGIVEIYRSSSSASADRSLSSSTRDFAGWSMAFRPLGWTTPPTEKGNSMDRECLPGSRQGSESDEDAEDAFSQLLLSSQSRLDLPEHMSKRMRTLVTTFVKLLNRPL